MKQEVILFVASSIDGFIARPNGSVDWLNKFDSPNEDYGYSEFMKGVGAIIMGSGTYQWMIDYGKWMYGETPTVVMTTRKFDKMADTIQFSTEPLSVVLANLTEITNKNIWVAGGGVLTQNMLREKLIDRMVISIIPIVLGEGISLFGDTKLEVELKAEQSLLYDSGIVQIDYRCIYT